MIVNDDGSVEVTLSPKAPAQILVVDRLDGTTVTRVYKWDGTVEVTVERTQDIGKPR